MTLGILQQFVPNVGDAWSYTLDSLSHYFERALAQPEAQVPGDATASRARPLEQ